jgi:hypothetical protein
MADKLEKDEKARIEEQVKKLGPEGLAEKAKELEDAKAEHDRPIPKEILTAFPVPDVKTITWISVQSVQEQGIGRKQTIPPNQSLLSRHISGDGNALPFFVQYDHVQVNHFFLMPESYLNAHFSPISSLSTLYYRSMTFQTGYDRTSPYIHPLCELRLSECEDTCRRICLHSSHYQSKGLLESSSRMNKS